MSQQRALTSTNEVQTTGPKAQTSTNGAQTKVLCLILKFKMKNEMGIDLLSYFCDQMQAFFFLLLILIIEK